MLYRLFLLLLTCTFLSATESFALAPDPYCQGSDCGYFEGVCTLSRKDKFNTVPSHCSKRADGKYEIWCKIDNGCKAAFQKTRDCDSADCKVYVNLAGDCAKKATVFPTLYFKPVISSFSSWDACERSRQSNTPNCSSSIPPMNPPEPFEGCYGPGLSKPQGPIDMRTPCERPNTSLTACVAEQTTAY